MQLRGRPTEASLISSAYLCWFKLESKWRAETRCRRDVRTVRLNLIDCSRECTRSGFCNFMHLRPISRELRKELYGRKRGGGGVGGGRSQSVEVTTQTFAAQEVTRAGRSPEVLRHDQIYAEESGGPRVTRNRSGREHG
ncbi:U2 snRNP splicing factor small subunit-like [Tropilaelaps mercedesae]|uniref:U2 snRNP splicing factor small subunit-like n=1 Tax=Tropilaelaps mercedesae TaxID=418985 RepID=A0A1V9X1M1_9ACAR|nr:U2 snRNP splicing factor small subunit-like [Tropilaelaps mercedesae]